MGTEIIFLLLNKLVITKVYLQLKNVSRIDSIIIYRNIILCFVQNYLPVINTSN